MSLKTTDSNSASSYQKDQRKHIAKKDDPGERKWAGKVESCQEKDNPSDGDCLAYGDEFIQPRLGMPSLVKPGEQKQNQAVAGDKDSRQRIVCQGDESSVSPDAALESQPVGEQE